MSAWLPGRSCAICGDPISPTAKKHCRRHRNAERIVVQPRISLPPTPQLTPCRIWQGRCDKGGYAYRNRVRLSRWVMEQALGRALTADEQVMHLCDNPPCYRYEHLRLGTGLDNMADMLAKGRDRVVGTRNGRAKLTPDDVREIRRRCADGEEASTIAVDFGISRSTVYDIKSGRIWKSVVLLDNVELT